MNEFVTVYSAEVMRRLRSRLFIMGLIFGALALTALMRVPSFIAASYLNQSKKIVLAGAPPLTNRAAVLLKNDFRILGTTTSVSPPTQASLAGRGAKGLIALTSVASGLRATIYANDPGDIGTYEVRQDLTPLQIQLASHQNSARVREMMSFPVTVRTVAAKFGNAKQSDAARMIGYLLLTLLYVLILMNSQIIMSSVAEEKTSRIAELLLSTVNPAVLLSAKIAASMTLAAVQMVIWIGIALVTGAHAPEIGPASAARGSDAAFSLDGVSGGTLAVFAIFFLLGYLQMATLFAAVGSLVNRTEDLGSVSGPLYVPVIAAFFIAMSALAIPDAPYVTVTSFIPLFSPFVMFARIVVSVVPLWQILVTIALNVLAIWWIALLSGKIYRVGMLLYGRPPRLRQILNVLRS